MEPAPFLLLLLLLLLLLNVLPIGDRFKKQPPSDSRPKVRTDADCSLSLVESVPQDLTYDSAVSYLSTFDAYSWLVANADTQLHFASLFWELRGQDGLADEGNDLFSSISQIASSVQVRIAYDRSNSMWSYSDVEQLSKLKNVETVGLNFSRLLGSGVLHTKMVVADSAHAYVGSSNMDWRSLTQIKEVGVLLRNCPTLAEDLDKVFRVYLLTGRRGRVPRSWPKDVVGTLNETNPWRAEIAGFKYSIFIGASPSSLCPPYRSRDIHAIVSAIRAAKEFVHIAVMDYVAKRTDFAHHKDSFWPTMDDELRAAAFRGVHVRLLVSHWRHSDPDVRRFLNSLTALNHSHVIVEGKFFVVPSFNQQQAEIPFARVNHNKYLVTESTGVICTSNYEGSYFMTKAGIAVSVTEVGRSDASASDKSLVKQLQEMFGRDWNSTYAHHQPPLYAKL